MFVQNLLRIWVWGNFLLMNSVCEAFKLFPAFTWIMKSTPTVSRKYKVLSALFCWQAYCFIPEI